MYPWIHGIHETFIVHYVWGVTKSKGQKTWSISEQQSSSKLCKGRKLLTSQDFPIVSCSLPILFLSNHTTHKCTMNNAQGIAMEFLERSRSNRKTVENILKLSPVKCGSTSLWAPTDFPLNFIGGMKGLFLGYLFEVCMLLLFWQKKKRERKS